MYAVQCPATMLWHPAVHHSLLLLRALQQRHTLQLIESNTAAPRLALPLLADCSARLRIVYTSTTTLQSASQPHIMSAHDTVHAASYNNSSSGDRHEVFCVRQPEHLLLHYLNASRHTSNATRQTETAAATLSDAMNAKLQRDLSDYLDTCVIAQQLCSATDALLVALSTENTEIVRGCHARLMDLLERLEGAIEPDTITATTTSTDKSEEEHESVSGSAAEVLLQAAHTTTTPSTAPLPLQQEVPLSTWPLYAMLYFFIEHAGLLRSAFPQLTQAYTTLRTNNRCVAQHHRLIQRTLATQSSTTATTATGKTHSASSSAVAHEPVSDKASVPRYPQADFLHDVQRRLAAYTSAAEERLFDGVTGDGGPLRYRTSGGRFGLQTVAARLPWTMQQSKLPRP